MFRIASASSGKEHELWTSNLRSVVSADEVNNRGAPVDARELIAKVADWSQRDPRVIAAGICGSYARGEARPGSDIDVCLLTRDPKSLLDDRAWILGFGADARIAATVEDYNLVQSVRVFYESTEAEFGIADEAWAQPPIDSETAAVINNGLQILYDPEGRLKQAIAFAARCPAS